MIPLIEKLDITLEIKKLPSNWSMSEYRDKVQSIVENKINTIIETLNELIFKQEGLK